MFLKLLTNQIYEQLGIEQYTFCRDNTNPSKRKLGLQTLAEPLSAEMVEIFHVLGFIAQSYPNLQLHGL